MEQEKNKEKELAEFMRALVALGVSTAEINRVAERVRRYRDELENSDAELTRKRRQAELEQKRADEERRKAEAIARQNAEKQAAESAREHIEKVTSMDLPLDFDNAFFSDKRASGVHADSIADGLVYSLTNLGRVDIEYISAITGADLKTVITSLKGAIYQNPETWDECFYKGWETAEEYLSGNLVKKFNVAARADAKYGGYFRDNLAAIERVLPPAVASDKIYITLGSPWVPTDVIDEFIAYLYNNSSSTDYVHTTHDELTGSWDITNKSMLSHYVRSYSTYGTPRMRALYILENTLNMRAIVVHDTIKDPSKSSGERRVVNQSETAQAQEKQQKLIKKFTDWVWADPARKQRLEEIYTEKYGCVKARQFDGGFLSFPGMSRDVELYPYQKNAVARILFTPNTLLAHDVGSGKTYVMIAAAMELKRMGLSQKNLFVVPNNIVGQWKRIFAQMYPNANVLCVEPRGFTKQKRAGVLKSIRDNDYDGVIMSYSCYDMIPLSQKFYIEQLQATADKAEKMSKQRGKRTAALKRKQQRTKEEIEKLLKNPPKPSEMPYFDSLGITRLFVDEAHNYKNVPVETKTSGVLGISVSGSAKCRDMLNKVRYVQKQNNGGGVVLATGTPITNSLTDVFVMQTYLQSGELALLDLGNFDSWIGMFAEKESGFEIDVDTNSFRIATRFGKFHNLPELTSLLASIADFHSVPSGGTLPEFDGYADALIGKSDALAEFLKRISERADSVRHGTVNRVDDNMLKITTDGRKAALDIRLVCADERFSYNSKVMRCAERVADIYYKTTKERSAQLVFCDTSTPKAGFNMYDELKCLLLGMGIADDEIAYVHSANTDRAREQLFKKVNSGEVRVLIGSTFKLGIGVNVQERLIAVHHLDVPWRPADMVQREGRILRQGNTNKKIYIYRYITEGSFDAYSWQLLESKQRFISALLSGSIEERSRADVDDCVLDYAEVKALAIGNPLIKKRVEAANELSRYVALQHKCIENKERLARELVEVRAEQRELAERIVRAQSDIAFTSEHSFEYTKQQRGEYRERIFSALRDGELSAGETPILQYRGFDVVLPAGMLREKPYVWLKREGKYYVEMSESERGVLVRLDNFIDELPEFLDKMQSKLLARREKERDILREQEKDEDYSVQIEQAQERLDKLDKQLRGTKK